MIASTALDPLFGLFIRVMVATGARRAEVCGLRWSDVDFVAGTLDVSRSYTVLPGTRSDSPTKSRSARTVMLDTDTVLALSCGWTDSEQASATCGLSSEQRRAGYIFAMDPTGKRAWRPDSANARWAKTRLAAGMSASVRLHDLRHFQATHVASRAGNQARIVCLSRGILLASGKRLRSLHPSKLTISMLTVLCVASFPHRN